MRRWALSAGGAVRHRAPSCGVGWRWALSAVSFTAVGQPSASRRTALGAQRRWRRRAPGGVEWR